MAEDTWIAVDWGTTHLRVWSLRGREVQDRAQSDKGMNSLTKSKFEPALLELISGWLPQNRVTQVLCCGMVGARQGWAEAPYARAPSKPASLTTIAVPTNDPRLSVCIVPGVSQAEPPDVMRGEETQIAGFLSLNDGWDGVICLPGTHTKWAHVSAGEVVSFQTFMTGEVFALLSEASVLRHSVSADGWDQDAFISSLGDTISRPESLAARLFRLRAAHLLQDADPGAARAQISGLLIGAELAGARPYWLGQQVAVIGADAMSKAYVDALEAQGVAAVLARSEAMTLAGLTALRASHEE